MNFTITADSLLEYQSTISQVLWTGLLCNRELVLQLETDVEDVMSAAGANCAITLTPSLATHSIEVSCRWIGEGNLGKDVDKKYFLRVAVINILLEYVGVLTA